MNRREYFLQIFMRVQPLTAFFKCPLNYIRRKEKQDIEDLEMPATKKIFLEQQSFKRQKSKEKKEYLDALNKEVELPLKSECF